MAEKPTKRQRRYLAYLLRLWRENAGEPPGDDLPHGTAPLWRASLERPQAGERLGFSSLVDLFDFLLEETGSTAHGSERSGENCSQPPVVSE